MTGLHIMRKNARGLQIAFTVIMWICVLFFVLTIAAMLLYPGGSVAVPDSSRYSFFLNFFSDLGQTHVTSGISNLPSMVLLVVALTTTALGLITFFFAFSRLFVVSLGAIWLSRIAIVCGIVAGISFIGVAFTPWNLFLQAHGEFVTWAFRAFLAAVVLLIPATLLEPGFPRRYPIVFAVFAVVLFAYVLLLAFGPRSGTPEGSIVQATGQKIIVYASILTILIQSFTARKLVSV